MNNPLELTGRVLGLGRPDTGRVLLVGARRDRQRLARCLGQGPWAGLPVVGFVDAGHLRYPGRLGSGRQLAVHPRTDPVPVLGGIDRLDEFVDSSRATHVVVAISGQPAKRLWPQMAHLRNSHVAVHWITEDAGRDEAAVGTAGTDPDGANDLDWRVAHAAWPLAWERLVKRFFDVAAAGLGLLFLAPLFLVVSISILVTSGRPIFYSQQRVGQGGRLFRMLKFRSMRLDAEGETGPIWASDHDARCTRIGAWLRHTNIDELPQLVNVLRGEMSLVGPRPERPVFVERFRTTVPDYDLRHVVAGGMTGWAQVHGWRGRTSLRKRIQYDLDYIQRWSFWFDVRVLLMTFQHVAWGKTCWTGPKRGGVR
jgi:exopolysaccharide biosynthesis polyprenyl glycosylphosphotransferase